VKARYRPLRYSVGRIDRSRVGGFDEVLGDDVDDTFIGVNQVAKTVLRVVEATGEANDEDWGVVIDDLSVAEGR